MIQARAGNLVDSSQQFLRRRDVERMCGLSRSTIYAMMAKGRFPRPVPITPTRVAWLLSDVLEWQQARIAERDSTA